MGVWAGARVHRRGQERQPVATRSLLRQLSACPLYKLGKMFKEHRYEEVPSNQLAWGAHMSPFLLGRQVMTLGSEADFAGLV